MTIQPRTLTLLPKQEEAIFSKASNIGYGGAWGSGKTIALCIWIKLQSEKKNNLILVGRKTYDELVETTQREFFELFPELKPFHNQSKNDTELPNGTVILWRYLAEYEKLTNYNLGSFAIDQAEEVPEECYIWLQGRLRRDNETITQSDRQSFIVFNPEGHNWVWKLFKEKPSTNYHLIETSSFDNPYLPDDYFERLKLLPENVIQRYVLGEWGTYEGLVYDEFSEKRHIIIPFVIPKEWDKGVVLDHGFTNPTAVLWFAIDYDGKVYVIDEHYEAGKVVSYHAEQIKKRDNSGVTEWLIDPSCKAKTQQRGQELYSIIDEYQDYGLRFDPAQNEVLGGINRVNEYFKTDKLFIFKNCENTIREVSSYKWAKLKPSAEKNQPENPVKKDDHTCLIGDSKINTVNGDIPIKDLVGQSGYVYSYKGERICVSKFNEVRKTGLQKEVWKVTFTDGGNIIATPEHPIMMRNGEYKQLSNLNIGDSLMPFYRRIDNHGHELIILNNNKKEFAHRLVYKDIIGDMGILHIHHKNEIKSDNRPENLVAMTKQEHCKYHITKRGVSTKFKEQARIATIRRMYNLESRLVILENLIKAQEKAKEWHKSEEGRKWHREHAKKIVKINYDKDKRIKENCRVCGKEFMVYPHLLSRSFYCSNNCKATARRKSKVDYTSRKCIRCGSDYNVYKYSKQKYCSRKCANNKVYNHKVASIEFYGYEDVYNMTVENTHNFACNGVIVHNCDIIRYYIANRPDVSTHKKEPVIYGENSPWAKVEEIKRRQKEKQFHHAMR